MHWHKRLLIAATVLLALGATAVSAFGGTGWSGRHGTQSLRKAEVVRLGLTPSSAQLAQCMPNAKLNVAVALTTDQIGGDIFQITARNLPPNRDYTIFLLEQAGAPFGAAEYIGDFSTNRYGNASNTLKLIVEEGFASTLVNGQRVRVDLNRIGVWFADPAEDDFCLGQNAGPVTPFDGDNEAGVQAFNSANAEPLPAP